MKKSAKKTGKQTSRVLVDKNEKKEWEEDKEEALEKREEEKAAIGGY